MSKQKDAIYEALKSTGLNNDQLVQATDDIFAIFKPIHKESIDKRKAKMLRRAADHVVETGVNQFRKADLNLIDFGQSAYGNFGALRYHGVIAKVIDKESEKPIKGEWLITRYGWEFLRGARNLDKFKMIQDNHIRQDLPMGSKISIVDVYKGAEELHTTFEYFDEHGQMVALRPTLPTENNQQRLI